MIRENRLYDELTIGERASIMRVCTANDLYVFAHASGNLNPLHLPGDGREESEAVAPSMWVGALVSAVLGNILPGAGTLYKSQSFTFMDRVHVGDELTVTVTVRDKRGDGLVVLDTAVTGGSGRTIAQGVAEVLAPTRKVLVKELSFVAHAEAAGLALGATVPIILTSRADGEKARLASCAVAALHRAWRAGTDTHLRRLAPAAE